MTNTTASTKSGIDCFFHPDSIAIIGASPHPLKPSNIIIKNMKAIGFGGAIYPVNARYGMIDDMECYPSIREIKDRVDIAVIATPAAIVPHVLRESIHTIKGAIVISGGFREAGTKGKLLEDSIKDIVSESNIRLIGPNCLGIYDTFSMVDTFFISGNRTTKPGRGKLSIVTQSGSFAVTIMDELALKGIGVARVISYGNHLDIDEADCLHFLAEDKNTDIVALYMESTDNGRRFIEAATRCSSRKPVIVVKVGKGKAGKEAAKSHTGAMAGEYEIYLAAFKKAGLIVADGYEEFIEACEVLSCYGRIYKNRTLVITNGGGIGVNIADACEEMGLAVNKTGKDTMTLLERSLPAFCSLYNPIDLTGSGTVEDYALTISQCLSEDYDLAIVVLLWGPPGISESIIDRVVDLRISISKPIIICSPGGKFTRAVSELFWKNRIPVFDTPEGAARAAAFVAGTIN